MNTKQPAPLPLNITPREIYYILHRHKWLIAIVAVLSVTAALILRSFWRVPYESSAMLMIKYVHDDKLPEKTAENQMSTDIRGEAAINSELDVLRSYDLASNVVAILGAQKIMARVGGGTNPVEAAGLIMRNFTPVSDKSDVIELKFSYVDLEMVQPILSQLIDAYLRKHREVHDLDNVNFLEQHKDELGGKIKEIDRAVQELKQKADVDSSVADSEKAISDEHSKILIEELDAEAEYAAEEATINELKKLVPASLATTSTSNTAPASAIPASAVSDYERACDQFAALQASLQALMQKYTATSTMVVKQQGEVDRADAKKRDLETRYPGIVAMKPIENKGQASASGPGQDPRVTLNDEIIKADALYAKIQVLDKQLAGVQTNVNLIRNVEGEYSQLLEDKANASAQFDYYSRKLEEERVKETIQGTANISVVEQPTPPARETKKFNKVFLGVLFGGLGLAFALPFAIELYLDRSLKRPLDVQARLGLPFFIAIPYMNGNGRVRALKKAKKAALLAAARNGNGNGSPPAEGRLQPEAQSNGHVIPWEPNFGLQPFYETLRDRLMTYFEMINLTHKPKLVAVTSCGAGAGVTSTAAGLASSLSETGEGNVLLVNMNGRDGDAHHFYKGKLNCGLEDMFEQETRQGGRVHDNLYVAKEEAEDNRLPRVLPKRFSHLLPKMKASDFDYIIFDMPPVSQISITPRLARFMDMVLLVVESGKTDRDVAARAAAVLSESKTNVGVVLNKNRVYGPRRHQHEI